MAYGDVDLNLLLVLERLLARQSVSEAATDLGLSASATSRALQRLRETLRDPLLVRAGNQLVPIELARELLAPTGRAVEAAREVFERERSCDPSQASGEFVLAMTAELQQALLPDIYDHVRSAAPGVDLRVGELGMQSPDEGGIPNSGCSCHRMVAVATVLGTAPRPSTRKTFRSSHFIASLCIDDDHNLPPWPLQGRQRPLARRAIRSGSRPNSAWCA